MHINFLVIGFKRDTFTRFNAESGTRGGRQESCSVVGRVRGEEIESIV